MPTRLTTRILILLLLGHVLTDPAWAQDGRASFSADSVKAAFLMRFGEYVVWPSQPANRSNFVIAVLGAPSVAEALRRIPKDRLIDGRMPEVREVSTWKSLGDEDILFIGSGANLAVAHSVASGKARLIVTDAQGGLEHGGMINFVLVDQRVRFEVSLPAVEVAGLSLSSRVLGVAYRVIKARAGAVPAGDEVGAADSARRAPAER